MKVLVTGATGTIGQAVCQALGERGDDVVGLSRNSDAASSTIPRVRWYSWQPLQERPPSEAFEDVDAVINLHGEKIAQPWTDEARYMIMESRRTGTRNLVEAIQALETKPKVLVSGSALGYYGDRGTGPVDEDAGPGEGFESKSSRLWEDAAQGINGKGIRLVIVRTGLVLTPAGGALAQMLPAFKQGLGGPTGTGDQFVSWVHVDDEVRILLWAVDDQHVDGVVNGTAPNPVTNREFAEALGRTLGQPSTTSVPASAIEEQLGPGLAKMVLGGARVLPRRTQELGYSFQYPEVDDALRDLVHRDVG